jgi:hypothetical protein
LGKRSASSASPVRRRTCARVRANSSSTRAILDQGEDLVARGGVGDQGRVGPGDVEVDQQQGLLDLVDGQTEDVGLLEHAPEQRLALGAADLKPRSCLDSRIDAL